MISFELVLYLNDVGLLGNYIHYYAMKAFVIYLQTQSMGKFTK